MEKQNVKSYQEFSAERFTKRVIYKKGEGTAFVLNFQSGQELPKHKHPGTELYLYVLQGSGAFTIDDEEITVTANDILHCFGHEELSFKNTGDQPTSLYVILNKLPSEKYAENI